MWALIFFLLLRIVLAWLADHRLRIPRLRLLSSLARATATFFSTPEMNSACVVYVLRLRPRQ